MYREYRLDLEHCPVVITSAVLGDVELLGTSSAGVLNDCYMM